MRMRQVRDLMDRRDYAAAREALTRLDHPLAREWLAKLDMLDRAPTPNLVRGRRIRATAEMRLLAARRRRRLRQQQALLWLLAVIALLGLCAGSTLIVVRADQLRTRQGSLRPLEQVAVDLFAAVGSWERLIAVVVASVIMLLIVVVLAWRSGAALRADFDPDTVDAADPSAR